MHSILDTNCNNVAFIWLICRTIATINRLILIGGSSANRSEKEILLLVRLCRNFVRHNGDSSDVGRSARAAAVIAACVEVRVLHQKLTPRIGQMSIVVRLPGWPRVHLQ